MLNLFKRKSKKELLQAKYEKLLNRSFVLSKTNRTASDKVFAEAQNILAEIDQIQD